jgi:hypothetical protein
MESMQRSAPHDSHAYAERILPEFAHHPERAFQMLADIHCAGTRTKLSRLIAQSWARTDINAAWSAVSRSSLIAADEQMMFSELWG